MLKQAGRFFRLFLRDAWGQTPVFVKNLGFARSFPQKEGEKGVKLRDAWGQTPVFAKNRGFAQSVPQKEPQKRPRQLQNASFLALPAARHLSTEENGQTGQVLGYIFYTAVSGLFCLLP